METKTELVHILLRESEKDGTKTEMKIMYSIFEKITFGAVALGVTLLILFMNSTKDIQLGSALSETDPVVSQEVATVSDEAVEPEVGSTVDVVTEVVSEDQMYTETIVFDDWRDGESFKEAFAQARAELGPGQVFEWMDNLYTTNYFYETTIVIGNEVIVDKENASIVDTENVAEYTGVTTYKDNETIDVSYDHLFGTQNGTTNEIASTEIQQQRIVVDEE